MSFGRFPHAFRFRLSALALGAFIALAGAAAQPALAANKKIIGDPLTIWIGDTGWFQELVAGNIERSFFPSAEPEFSGGPVNAGFVLAFPSSQTGVHADIENETWGWTPNLNGPNFDYDFIPVSQTDWTPTGPITQQQETRYKVTSDGTAGGATRVEVLQTATYINGESNFVISYNVTNASGANPVKFSALVGADLNLNNSDCGTGVFRTGPPRFVGGSSQGRVGGFTEAATTWTSYFEGWYGLPGSSCDAPAGLGVWHYLEGAKNGLDFPNTIDPAEVDNGVGIMWDTYFASGLGASATATFQHNTLGTVPGELNLAPSTQSITAGSPASLTATATDSVGAVSPGILVRFTTSGANVAAGSATTNTAGQATLSYTPTGAGTDTISAYEDVDGDGVHDAGELSATATVTVAAAPSGPGGPGSPGSSPDKTPPKVTLLVASKVKLKKFLKGLSIGARVNESASLKIELHGAIPKGKVKAKGFTKLLARQSLPMAGAGLRATRLRPSKKGVGKAKKFSVRLRVTATDRAGNKTVASKTIKVR